MNGGGHVTRDHLIILPLAARFFPLARISSHLIAHVAESISYLMGGKWSSTSSAAAAVLLKAPLIKIAACLWDSGKLCLHTGPLFSGDPPAGINLTLTMYIEHEVP